VAKQQQPKPPGWRKFADLAKRLSGVSKDELDAKLAEPKRERRKK